MILNNLQCLSNRALFGYLTEKNVQDVQVFTIVVSSSKLCLKVLKRLQEVHQVSRLHVLRCSFIHIVNCTFMLPLDTVCVFVLFSVLQLMLVIALFEGKRKY